MANFPNLHATAYGELHMVIMLTCPTKPYTCLAHTVLMPLLKAKRICVSNLTRHWANRARERFFILLNSWLPSSLSYVL